MKKILIPIDFSPVADRALQYALALSDKLRAQVLIYHAGEKDKDDLRAYVQGWLQMKHKDAVVDYICSDTEFNVEVVKTLIAEHKCDLVVMGTHGEKTLLAPKIFGSNTAAVLEEVSVPVIAVPPDHPSDTVSRIAYAADLINLRYELGSVVDFAMQMHASVNMFHVAPIFPDLYDLEKKDVNAIIEDVKQEKNFQYITYHIEETKRDNQIVKGINNFIDEHPSDLLVVFHSSRSWIDKIITPSSTMKEISHIRIPLLVFPKKAEDEA